MKFLFQIVILLFFTSCANIIPPTGGPKDTNPPQLNTHTYNLSATKNGESKLIYEFDERIQSHEFEGNFYISPPLKEVSYKIKPENIERIRSHLNSVLSSLPLCETCL